MILDVVYNHFRPVRQLHGRVFAVLLIARSTTRNGASAINFDGENSGPVREFVAENAAYWVREFHLDGLRLDATQSIVDDSDEHIVAQLTRAARAAAGERSILIFSEDETEPLLPGAAARSKAATASTACGTTTSIMRAASPPRATPKLTTATTRARRRN